MYLIIEKSNQIYAYFESETQFKKMQKQRVAAGYTQLDLAMLDEECLVTDHGNNFYIVVPVDKKAVKAQQKKRSTKKGKKK
jgi:hypothetical protein